MSRALIIPAQPHRRVQRRLRSWWGRAFWRAVEELTDDERQLVSARALARSGRIGGLLVETGRVAAGVAEEAGVWTVTGTVPPLDHDSRVAFLELTAGRGEAMLRGELSHDLVEQAEEAGGELVPYGSDLAATCSCPGWQRASRHGGVCEHALGVLVQLTELLDEDPLVLLHLRGIHRDDLAVRPSDEGAPSVVTSGDTEEIELAAEAALRAAQLLAEVDADLETD
jgi:uncharacterized Zn finger protein